MKRFTLYIGLLILLLSFAKCTVKKRYYRDGYYVTWNKKVSSRSKISKLNQEKLGVANSEKTDILALNDASNANLPLSASNNNALNSQLFENKTSIHFFSADTCGDKIFKFNGEIIDAKIIEVSAKAIKYKPCDNLNGPLFVLGTDKIAQVIYANRQKETFEANQAQAQQADDGSDNKTTVITRNVNGEDSKTIKYRTDPNNIRVDSPPIDPKKLRYHKYAIPSFILGFFFWLIVPGVLSIIFGVIAWLEIDKHPDLYKGEFFAGFWPLIFGGVLFFALLALLGSL